MDKCRLCMLAGIFISCLACGCGVMNYSPPEPGLKEADFSLLPDTDRTKDRSRKPGGEPSLTGLRYWEPVMWDLPYTGCYVTVIKKEDSQNKYEMWQNTWGDKAENRTIVVKRGNSVGKLGEETKVIGGDLINDVLVPLKPGSLEAKQPWTLSPLRGYTRPYMSYHKDYGYVLMSCVCPDYKPGTVTLMPAILTSPDGVKWKYHGMINGEPQEEQQKRGSPIWSDGGSIFRMPDHSWRMYLNGFGPKLSMLSSDSLDGPWKFMRDESGKISELLPPLPGDAGLGCFPHVLRVKEDEWHLWYSDRWTPHSIWHFWSHDGIKWSLYGKQPEITRQAVNTRAIKCLRAYVENDSKDIIGLLSVWDRTESDSKHQWQLFMLRMPSGAPPE